MIATPARALFFSLLATLTLELSGLEELIGMKENPHDTDPNKVSIFYA